MSDDLRALVDRCRHGDDRAISQLVDRFRQLVFGVCFRMLGHRQDAEDVAQESFVRAFRSLHRWDPTREFRPWLLAIAGNRCRTHLSLRRRRPTSVAELEQWVDPREDDAAVRLLTEEVDRALSGLREDYRRAFLLFHQQQLSYAEIAAALDCPIGTVRTWVHRARQELSAALRQRGVLEESRHAL